MNYFGMADADWGWKKRYVYKQLRCNVNKLIIFPITQVLLGKKIIFYFSTNKYKNLFFKKGFSIFLAT